MKNDDIPIDKNDCAPSLKEESGAPHKESENRRLTFINLGIMLIGVALGEFKLWQTLGLPFDIITLGIALYGGFPIYKEAFETLKEKRINTEVSMAIAIVAALAIGQFIPGLVVAFFAVLSELIESYTWDKGREAIGELLKLAPQKALVRRNGKEWEAYLSEVQKDDVVIVKPGTSIPVDGIVIKGSSAVNQAPITGESLPVDKQIGDSVFAGTVNESDVLELKVTNVGENSTFGKIIRVIQQAEDRRAPIDRISEKMAGWLVYIALSLAALTYLFTRNLNATIAVIVVAGACGVATGTPLAILASIGRAAKRKVIVKGGDYIEELSKITTILLDKTGTITYGDPRVQKIVAVNGKNEKEVVKLAAIAEKHSAHPLAKAILKKATSLGITVPEYQTFKTIAGKGLLASYQGKQILVGNRQLLKDHQVTNVEKLDKIIEEAESDAQSTILVAYGNELIGSIHIADEIRKESIQAVKELKQMGIKVIMLTGDNERVANAISKKLSLDGIYANMLPEDKLKKVQELKKQGEKVAMVGDGINDAPALIEASVGIAMGAGTDVALEAADVALLSNDLLRVVESIKIGKDAYRTIMQNFYGTLIIDAIGMIAAVLGFLTPLLAAFVHIFSEFIFIMNSSRIFMKKEV